MPKIPGKVCVKCHIRKPLPSFPKSKNSRGGRLTLCKFCNREAVQRWLDKDPRKRLFQSSKANACSKGIDHSISIEDIKLPRTCKYLGIAINYQKAKERGRLRSFDAPSIDRIDSARGYVVGNIQIISDLANRKKQDATISQLIAFAEGVFRVHGPKF